MNTKNVLLGLLFVLVFAVGFIVGRFSLVGDIIANVPATNSTTKSVEADTNDETVDAGVTIQAASLSDGQKKLLNALGIDADEITVTPEMIACAEAGLGQARVDEIMGGATPSFTEGLKLATCYK